MQRHVYDRAWEGAGTCWGSRGGLGAAAWGLGVLAALEGWEYRGGGLAAPALAGLSRSSGSSPALARQRFVGACRGAAEPCPSSLGGVSAGPWKPRRTRPCAAHQGVCGQRPARAGQRGSSARCAGGRAELQFSRPFMHLGFGPPLGELNI